MARIEVFPEQVVIKLSTPERTLALRDALAKGYERAGQDAVTGMWRVMEGLAAR